MGQKVNPVGLRIATHNVHDSIWYVKKCSYASVVFEDDYLTRYIEKKFRHASISKILIKRKDSAVDIAIHSAKPGIIVGKKGVDADALRSFLSKKLNSKVEINIAEVKRPNSSAVLVAKSIAFQLERRSSFRRVAKKSLSFVMRDSGVRGVKISCAGRLSGAEIARTEFFRDGSVPLHKLKANVDYGLAEAHTTYGSIGVKVWIYKGDLLRSNRGSGVYSKENKAQEV